MKKGNIVNLIKYHVEGNDSAFVDEAYEIASSFNESGDFELANYIRALLSGKNAFKPQGSDFQSSFFTKIEIETTPLFLSEPLTHELHGIINAVGYKTDINKFLFYGAPGTGKTECVKHLARLIHRDLYSVNFDNLIDCKLGQTSKNISDLFDEINNLSYPEQIIVLFDEIDALALDRINNNDLREMGRATSALLKGFDSLNSKVIIVATTNLHDNFDKAVIRRFDKAIDFSNYSFQDLCEVSEKILEDQLRKYKFAGHNIQLFRKLLKVTPSIPYPGEMKNIIRSSIVFSNPDDEFDYLRAIFKQINPSFVWDFKEFKKIGLSVREMEIMTKVSKSKIAKCLSEETHE